MSAYRAALLALSTLIVPGVTTTFPADAPPHDLPPDHLPALIALPGDPYRARGVFGGSDGLQAVTYGGSASSAVIHATHVLLVARADQPYDRRPIHAVIIDLIDAYLTAIAADLTFAGTLSTPARVTAHPIVAPQTIAFGGQAYAGCLFRHTWTLALPTV